MEPAKNLYLCVQNKNTTPKVSAPDLLVGTTVSSAASESEVAKGNAVDMYQWLREICSWRLINHDD